MSSKKYIVGEKIMITRKPAAVHHIGAVGVIERVVDSTHFFVKVDGRPMAVYTEDCLQVVK